MDSDIKLMIIIAFLAICFIVIMSTIYDENLPVSTEEWVNIKLDNTSEYIITEGGDTAWAVYRIKVYKSYSLTKSN